MIFEFRGVSRTQSNISDGAFCRNSERLKVVKDFCKKVPPQIFDWVLNTPLEIHGKNKEKQSFLLIHTDTLILLRTYHFRYSDSTKCTKMSK